MAANKRLYHHISIRSNVPIIGFVCNPGYDHTTTLLQVTSPETHKVLPGLCWGPPFGTDRKDMEDTTLRNMRRYTKVVDLEEGGAWKYVNHDEHAQLQSALAGVTAVRAWHWSVKSRDLLQSAKLSAKVLFDCCKPNKSWRWKHMYPGTDSTIIFTSGGDLWCILEGWCSHSQRPPPQNHLYIVVTSPPPGKAQSQRDFIDGLKGFADHFSLVRISHDYRFSIVGLETLDPRDLGMEFPADSPWETKKAMIYQSVKNALEIPDAFYEPPDDLEELHSTVDSIRLLSRKEFKEEVGEELNLLAASEPPRLKAPTDPGYWMT